MLKDRQLLRADALAYLHLSPPFRALRNRPFSMTILLYLVRITRHSVLDQFYIQLHPALLNSPNPSLPVLLLSWSHSSRCSSIKPCMLNLNVNLELTVFLVPFSLNWIGDLKTYLCQVELHCLRCGGVEHVAFCWPKRAAVQHMLTKNKEDLFQMAYSQLCSRRTASACH